MAAPVVVYASEGRQLHTLALHPDGSLSVLSTLQFPEIVQYGALDPARHRLYVSVSDRAARHAIFGLKIDAASGVLDLRGEPLWLDERVIHLCADQDGRHLLLALPLAGRLAVASIHPDGSMKVENAGGDGLDVGYFVHQVRLDPDGRGVVACVMGWDAQDGAAERPGSLVSFRYEEGVLTRTGSVGFGPGRGPRHLDYAHGKVYVAVERGNRLAVFDYADGVLAPAARFELTTLADPGAARPGQRAGAIHFHPNRRWLYVTNRGGAANDIALFLVDEASGRPTAAGFFDTEGVEPRTFTIDPGGRFLIVANHSPGPAQPRSWVVFRIAEGGRLERLRRFERYEDLFWIGSAGVGSAG